jgi:predicted NUDIX family NTP pyrophosphohydrolase
MTVALVTLGMCAPGAAAGANGNFQPPVNYAAGDFPASVAVGDFNGDSDPDLAIANEGSGDVSILLGAAGGSFTGPTSFGAGSGPTSIAVGDFNGDADPDLAVANFSSNNVSVLLGAPGGSFTGPTSFGAGSGPTSIATGDFNGDSDPDLAVTNGNVNTVSILLGAAGGAFTGPTDFPTATNSLPRNVAIGDFNGDSDPDLAVANDAGTVSILVGAAGGTFSGPTDLPVSGHTWDLAVGDFNGDSDPDLAVTNGHVINDFNHLKALFILLGTAGSGFTAPTGYETGSFPRSVAVGDFNGDSDPDLAVGGVSIHLGAPGGGFTGPNNFAAGSGTVYSVAVGDFNSDADPDLAVANSGSDNVSILLAGFYVRPKGATPMRVSLVPAYTACASSNRSHGAPLAFPSCAPPEQASSFLTVGTPDANGAAPQAIGSLTLSTVVGGPFTPDEADVKLAASTTDVRLRSGLGDYSGELQANFVVRLTDRASGAGGDQAATLYDFNYTFAVPCQTTASTSIGSTCSVSTSADALAPGTVTESARTIWQLDKVTLFDGGSDGVASTLPNTPFETQGVLVP